MAENDIARARAVLADARSVDPTVLVAVRDGLLTVPADDDGVARPDEVAPRLAIRRRA